MNNYLLVFLGGGVGSLFRYGISVIIPGLFKSSFPVATLTSNILSCIILALTVSFFYMKPDTNHAWKLLLVTGVCGGFSTFSTFSFETVELFRTGQAGYAIANILISVITCVGIIYLLAKNPAAA